jgi:hypothetical protein
MVSLGAKPCESDIWADELKMRDLKLKLQKGQVERDSTRAQRLYDYHYGGQDRVLVQGPEMPRVPVTGYFRGRTVAFVGIPPSYLAGEQYITPQGSSFYSDPTYITVTDHVSGVASTSSDEVWCPYDVPGYAPTGRVYRNLREQRRQDVGSTDRQEAICVYYGQRVYEYEDIKGLRGVFCVARTVDPKYVSGPGGLDKRRVTVINKSKVFKGGGYILETGTHGSFLPGEARPVRCGRCQTPGTFSCTSHLYYTSVSVNPPMWAHLYRELHPG